MKYSIYLGIAVIFEVFGTAMLKLSKGFTVLYPSLGVVAGLLLSFVYLGLSLRGLPLSTTYAIWGGLGTAYTAAIGVIVFNESVAFLKVLALFFIIAGVVILNKSKEERPVKQVGEDNAL